MSTILKAVQELERRHQRLGGQAGPTRYEHQARVRWAMLGALLVTLSAAALGAVFLIRAQLAPPTLPAPRPSSVRQSQAVPLEPVRQEASSHHSPPAPPRPPAASDDEPQGRVGKARPAAPLAGPLAGPLAAALAPPKGHAAPQQAAPPRQPAAQVATSQDSAVPGLQVQAVSYSAVGGQSTVTLQTGGARRVTLHEGESADGVEVQLIQPHTVYLRHEGNILAVSVGP